MVSLGLRVALAASFALVPMDHAQGQDDMNQRFLQNMAHVCAVASAASKPTCTAVLDAYRKEGVDPEKVTAGPVLKKVLVEIGKRLVGLGGYVSGGVGIFLTGERIAVEMFDAGNEKISLADRRDACVRDMSTIVPADFERLVSGRKSLADAILRVLETK